MYKNMPETKSRNQGVKWPITKVSAGTRKKANPPRKRAVESMTIAKPIQARNGRTISFILISNLLFNSSNHQILSQ